MCVYRSCCCSNFGLTVLGGGGHVRGTRYLTTKKCKSSKAYSDLKAAIAVFEADVTAVFGEEDTVAAAASQVKTPARIVDDGYEEEGDGSDSSTSKGEVIGSNEEDETDGDVDGEGSQGSHDDEDGADGAKVAPVPPPSPPTKPSTRLQAKAKQ